MCLNLKAPISTIHLVKKQKKKKQKRESRKCEFQHRNFINFICSIHLAAEVSGFKCHLPHAHMSTGFPYGSFLRTSGDKYPGVPANPGKVIWRSGVLVTQRARFSAYSNTFLCNYQTILILCLRVPLPKNIEGWILTKPCLLVALHLDSQPKISQLDRRTLQLAGQ